MHTFIDAALGRSRSVLLILCLILVAGSVSYINIPKESEPDIAIPIIYVSISHEGISPEDAERLLVRPLEKELRSVEGLRELTASAMEGRASITLEFDAGFDEDQALADVREAVDTGKVELPDDTDEPTVKEVNVALFPVLVVTLHGNVREQTLIALARDLQDALEGLTGVLEADIAGDREDLLEVIIDPVRFERYNLSQQDIFEFVSRNNQLVAAGALDTGSGRFAVKVPGVLETVEDLLNLPVKVSNEKVVTFRDIALVHRTFKDPVGFARVNGQPAIALEISKRIGTNIIDTINEVRATIDQRKQNWPEGVQVSFSQDKSEDVRNMLIDLQNNVLIAVLLVMIVVIAVLGIRAASLVSIAIPGSFLAGILFLSLAGLTVNIVVLFALIMAVGMLVDGAIVVTELADRKMAEGFPKGAAFGHAARRMAWPIIAATATTLAAFMPLLFWPGMVGEFMKYLPITLIATLSASLFMALVFVPTLGSLFGRRAPASAANTASVAAAESGELETITGLTAVYIRLMRTLLIRPGRVILVAFSVLFFMYWLYGQIGKGVEFFPDVEPENAVIHVSARGDLSVYEKDLLVQEVESQILDMEELATVYARSGTEFRAEVNEDVIGLVQIEFVDWKLRRPANQILAEIRERVSGLAGIVVEVRKEESGPPVGKPVQVQLSSLFPELLEPAVRRLREKFEEMDDLIDITDTRPVPGIEWQIQVDRVEAGRFGADVRTVGNAIQLVTNGVKVGDYRPDDTEDEVEIRVRFPFKDRTLKQLERLRIPTSTGLVPVSNFVSGKPVPRVGTIERADGSRVMTVAADVRDGVLVDASVQQLRRWIDEAKLDPRIKVEFKGEDKEQREAEEFLMKAFAVALFVMAIILVTQFNSFYQALLILSAVIFSTVGVLLGLLVANQSFGIVMTGIGVISLAGIVVNNNIVLIDTFNRLREAGMEVIEAILRTGAQRLRPVLLTTVTTILGLLPMALGININLLAREVSIGAPSAQWWTQLATAVVGGLGFATILTLVLTPCLLMFGERFHRK